MSPNIYVANYFETNVGGAWLSAPLFFKFNEARDTLYILYSGNIRSAASLGCGKYKLLNSENNVIYEIKKGYIDIYFENIPKVSALNKSMI